MDRYFTASGWVRPAERFRTSIGAVIGLSLVGGIGLWLNTHAHLPLALIAPLGASSVLLFAVPASPLAQPWSIIGGNLVASLAGLAAGAVIPQSELAAALAVGFAIAFMASLRCLHPPSGAVALLAAVSASHNPDHGASFLLWSVMANSALLLMAAVLFHRLTGHIYPEFLRKHTYSPVAQTREQDAATDQIVSEVLNASDDMMDISTEELRDLYDRISLRLALKTHEAVTCRAVMQPMPEALSPDAPLTVAFDTVLRQPEGAMLVTDEQARVIGLVTIADFTRRADLTGEQVRVTLGQRLRNAVRLRPASNHVVADIMQAGPAAVAVSDPFSRAITTLIESSVALVAVMGEDGRAVGVITLAQALTMLARSEHHS